MFWLCFLLSALAFARNDPHCSQVMDISDPYLRETASQFDALLHGKLSQSEQTLLKENCIGEPERNPFCYILMNRTVLEAQSALPSILSSKRDKQIMPLIKENQILNWLDLREANFKRTVRVLGSAKPKTLELIKAKAMEESSCPNQIAVSIAAVLEDGEKLRISSSEIAALYEKAALCMTDPIEKELLLTRAGLFYFVSESYPKSAQLFSEASTLEKVFVGRSLYWLHRTSLVMGNPEDSKKAVSELQRRYPFSFHTLMALSELNLDPGTILRSEKPLQSKRSAKSSDLNTLLNGAELLQQFGYEDSARQVLDWAVPLARLAEPEVRIYLAELGREGGNHQLRFTMLSELLLQSPNWVGRETLESYFPKPFYDVFRQNASGLDLNLLFAIARQESAFNPKATSSVRAKGLLQVLPKTGRSLGSKTVDLTEPASNINIGSRYFKMLLKKMNGELHLAIAAYNAGPQKVTLWLTRYPKTEPILFIDLIPYRETREYVASVLRNYYWYRRLEQREETVPMKIEVLALPTIVSPP